MEQAGLNALYEEIAAQLALPRMLMWSFNYTPYDGETLNWGGPAQSCIEGFQKCKS